MPSIQKKIRDLQRLLRKKGDDAPASELDALQSRVAELSNAREGNAKAEQEKKLSQKYHMVKFVERKKLTRKIRVVDTKLKGQLNDKDRNALSSQRANLEDDLTYVVYYPRDMKYVALFANNDDDKNTARASVSDTAKKAREISSQERKDAVEAGSVDKVQHAINVEYGIETEGYEPGSNVTKIKKPVKSITAHREEYSEKRTQQKLHNKTKSKEKEFEKQGEQDLQVRDMIFGSPSADATHSKDNKTLDSSSDSDSDSDNDSDSSSSGSSSDGCSSSDQEGPAKKRSKPTTTVNQPVRTPVVKADAEDDDFFLEGDTGDSVKQEIHPEPKGKGRGGHAQTQGGKGNFGGSNVDRIRKNGRNGRSADPAKPMHKQDARLLKWQTARKAKPFLPQGAPTTAKWMGPGSSETRGGEGDSNSNPKKNTGTKRPFDKTNSNSGGEKKPFEKRPAREQRGGLQKPDEREKKDTRSLWERSGGISAAAVTLATISKNKGTISASQGKKITFD